MITLKNVVEHRFTFCCSDIVDRILDITYSVDNLILSGTNTSWISGETGEARVQISLDRFYHVSSY